MGLQAQDLGFRLIGSGLRLSKRQKLMFEVRLTMNIRKQ